MRISLTVLSATALALSACQPGEAPPAVAPTATATATAPKGDAPDMSLAALTGEYRVAGIDGTEVGGGIGIALTVTDREIWFDPRCAGFSWSYTYRAGNLTTDRPVGPTCRIAVHPEQQRLAAALDAVTQARRTPSNGIALSGGGHSVTLYSQ